MYVYLNALAPLLFGASGYFMKLSEGLTKATPSVCCRLMLVLGGLTYVMVMALEALTTFVIAAFFFGERPTPFKVAATGVIVEGVVAMQLVE